MPRGTPRLANRLLKRVRDFAQVKYEGKIDQKVASFALDLLEVDTCGLDQVDRRLLLTLIEKFNGGPVGLDTLAAAIGEDSGTIEGCLRTLPDSERISEPDPAGADGHRAGFSPSWYRSIKSFFRKML